MSHLLINVQAVWQSCKIFLGRHSLPNQVLSPAAHTVLVISFISALFVCELFPIMFISTVMQYWMYSIEPQGHILYDTLEGLEAELERQHQHLNTYSSKKVSLKAQQSFTTFYVGLCSVSVYLMDSIQKITPYIASKSPSKLEGMPSFFPIFVYYNLRN